MKYMQEKDKAINKDLILREKLAWERTSMANDRTLLAFIRTSLYFTIAGLTINELVEVPYGDTSEIIFWIMAVVLLAAGIINYIRQKKKLKESRKQIGNYIAEAGETF